MNEKRKFENLFSPWKISGKLQKIVKYSLKILKFQFSTHHDEKPQTKKNKRTSFIKLKMHF
jgi:hypothetical protein